MIRRKLVKYTQNMQPIREIFTTKDIHDISELKIEENIQILALEVV